MKVPLSWLKEYIDIEDIPQDTLAEELNNKVMEIKQIHNLSLQYKELEKVIVGEVKDISIIEKDYKILFVNIGKEDIKVVVSPKVEVKRLDKLAIALPGAKLFSGIEVILNEIKGVYSEGMVCSEYDLGIGDIKDTPIYLPQDTQVGKSIKEALELDDIVFEFDVEPNRVDLLSIYGFARELKAILKRPIRQIEFYPVEELTEPNIKVEIDSRICSRYCILIVEDVKIFPSPAWLQNRLRKLDTRPINNIVDLTNYVMFEIGQPLHAFDFDRIKEKLIVRRGKKTEILFTLDGKKRTLDTDTIVIADGEYPIALGGIIGGEDTSISDSTCKILVESANFYPNLIRKASRRLGIRTESSCRFERGPAQQLALFGIKRFAKLITYGKPKNFKDEILHKEQQRKIILYFDKVNSLLGTSLSSQQIKSILDSLEFSYSTEDSESIEVTPPYFRKDIEIQEDLVEEIGRIYGYDKIPYTLPKSSTYPSKNWSLFWDNFAKDILIGCGMVEIQTTSLYGDKEIELFSINKEHLELDNPLSCDRKYMRLSLLPQLIFWIKENLKHHHIKDKKSAILLFELNRIYIPYNTNIEEKKVLVGGITSGIKLKDKATDFFQIKRIIEILLNRLGIKDYYFSPIPNKIQITHILYDINKLFHPYRTAVISIKDDILGLLGEIHPEFLKRELEMNYRIAVFDIDFERLTNIATVNRKYKQYSTFPAVKEDYSFLVDKDVLAGDMIKSMYAAGEGLISSVELIDLYEGENIGEKKKSLTFSVIFQSYSGTLTTEQIKYLRQKLIDSIILRFGAELRGKL